MRESGTYIFSLIYLSTSSNFSYSSSLVKGLNLPTRIDVSHIVHLYVKYYLYIFSALQTILCYEKYFNKPGKD